MIHKIINNAYFRLMRFDKPIGIYLLLYPTLWSLFLAKGGFPDMDLLLIFGLGVVLMRAAGCVINDYADRDFDKWVKRTQNRPLTNAEIPPKNALILFAFLLLMAFILVLMTNEMTIKLAFIAVLLTSIYPFSKRWTHLPQLVLGVAFALSVLMAFAATTNTVPTAAWWIFASTVIWTLIYDTLYAMADKDEDIKIGLKSTAILFNKHNRLIIAILQIILLALLIKIGSLFHLTVFYHIALIGVAGLMIYHQFLIKNEEKSACFQAFLHNHFIGLVIFIGIFFSVV